MQTGHAKGIEMRDVVSKYFSPFCFFVKYEHVFLHTVRGAHKYTSARKHMPGHMHVHDSITVQVNTLSHMTLHKQAQEMALWAVAQN